MFTKRFQLFNNLFAWIVFVISAAAYLLTLEDTASFWDCGEFIASGYKLEVGHPPGNPIFMLTARFFANFASDPLQVAYLVNIMSGLLSAATILFLFWTISYLARKVVLSEDTQQMSVAQAIAILGSAAVGSLAYAFSDTFWFSAVEGEVYAYSSLCTAVVFWLILKWESVADEPHADRYIILIAYVMGLSIGVHLLNLLCIPAIVLVYYYKKWDKTNVKGSIIALLVSFVVVILLLYGLIPGFVKVAGWSELFFVNILGAPFQTGVIVYFVAVLSSIVWGIYETYTRKSNLRLKISFIVGVSLNGLPFLGDGAWIGLLLIAALSVYLFSRQRVAVRVMNMILVSLMVIVVGYSSYALILIRSAAAPPMDQNSPDNIFAIAGYLNREQYGDRPLLYGSTFVSNPQRDNTGKPEIKKGKNLYDKKIKTSAQERDNYVQIGTKDEYIYNPDLNTLFPRMYSREARHINAYKEWSNFNGRPVRTTVEGETKTVMAPTFGENLRFFLDYQLNFMYWRYFMWNFAGRQNDNQGSGEIANGNWISGFNFIDKHLAGDQTLLPDVMRENKGRNVYYMLPLLLGLIGLLYQAYAGKRGIESFWVTFFLFFMTGIAIVIYLNQTPGQPRERDYAFAGSFYAFSIWIGLGVAAIARGLERYIPATPAAIFASLLALCIPAQMLSQTWDDHNRSGRTVARDFAKNYLSCVGPNGIIFTNGDNDTFPLWYVQEVEGYRTDVRVCNLSYLQTDWYITQMKSPAYESQPLPLSMQPIDYSQGKLDYAYLINRFNMPISVDGAMGYLLSKDEATKFLPEYQLSLEHIPSSKLYIDVDTAAVLASGVLNAENAHKVVPRMELDFGNKQGLAKSELAIVDMLNNLSKEHFKRPIYFAVTVGGDMYLGLDRYFSLEGLAYRIVPADGGETGLIDTGKMYDNMMNKFSWGGIDNPNVYLDENVRRMARTLRVMFVQLIDALLEEGKVEQAAKVVDKALAKIPATAVPHDESSLRLAEALFKLKQHDRGVELMTTIGENALQHLAWYSTLTPNQLASIQQDVKRNGRILSHVAYVLDENGEKKLAEQYSLR